ncbi:MAG: F0F1 ATP synthase subunit A [Ferruginibacter sp.]
MASKSIKSLLVAAFSVFFIGFSAPVLAQHEGENPASGPHEASSEKLDPAKIILDHIQDAHEWHFFSIGDFHATLPLPVILYSPTKGFSMFSSGKFHHGHEEYNGYRVEKGEIVATDGSKVYDFSLTKNVVQMLLALTILVLLMTGIAKKYKNGQGVTTAPKGWQNAIEPVITFIRDEAAKPNLGAKWQKYLPYLLTIFFFILINNLFGLIPGSANVTGNVAFTLVLGVISFFVILFSTNGHFWGHIFWPPGVPLFVKVILIPIEFASFFIKPAALIIRLFANMIAGHIIILSFVSLIFIFGEMTKVAGWGFSPLSVAFTVFIYFIEILVAFIQAFIFTNLTAVFIGQAFEGAHHDEHHADDHHAKPAVA